MPFGTELLETEYGRFGLEFAKLLASGQYDIAQAMLSDELQQRWSVEKVKEKFERMIQHGVVTEIEPLEGYAANAHAPKEDIGGVYVSICGHDPNEPLLTFNEAVIVFVRRYPDGPRIREIYWGQP